MEEGVVYQITCSNCDHVYPGKSKRILKVHMAEHKQAVQNRDANNGIAVQTAHHASKLFSAHLMHFTVLISL